MRIKEIKKENGERRLVATQKKKKVLKVGPLKRKDTKKLVLYMKNAGTCPCPQLDDLSGSFLVMGRKVGGRLLVLAIYRWEKKNKEMKFAVKFMFSYPCSLHYPFFYGSDPHWMPPIQKYHFSMGRLTSRYKLLESTFPRILFSIGKLDLIKIFLRICAWLTSVRDFTEIPPYPQYTITCQIRKIFVTLSNDIITLSVSSFHLNCSVF